jgi:8-amino-7-oxononanoate synthase
VIDYLRLNSRPFLFTAAGVPAALGAALAAMRIAQTEDWRREALRERSAELRRGLAELGYDVQADATTPIVALPMADRWSAVRVWRALLDAGVYTNCTMGSAVPGGKALLRLSVMATHTEQHISRALKAFAELTSTLTSTPASTQA